ncbi:MAG: Ig-like domain-containing protein [Oscillospiraceae bacterium]|nr:Ig-like domain-containing protein [Oscillospiraceae bacterium]
MDMIFLNNSIPELDKICLCFAGNGKATLTATYPSKDSTEEISGSSGKISYLTLEMEVGDTIRLGTVTEPEDADVKWSSSKSSIATVSASGKVTAKKEGSTIVTAKCGSSVKNIKIIVL